MLSHASEVPFKCEVSNADKSLKDPITIEYKEADTTGGLIDIKLPEPIQCWHGSAKEFPGLMMSVCKAKAGAYVAGVVARADNTNDEAAANNPFLLYVASPLYLAPQISDSFSAMTMAQQDKKMAILNLSCKLR